MGEIQSRAMTAQTQVTGRFSTEQLERIDRIAEALSKFSGNASRADALRYIVTKGLDAAEQELGIAKGKAKR
jgi:hypothetical protein